MNEHEQMIQDCIQRESRLSDWERKFIDSIEVAVSKGRGLTKGQRDKLEEIWERIT